MTIYSNPFRPVTARETMFVALRIPAVFMNRCLQKTKMSGPKLLRAECFTLYRSMLKDANRFQMYNFREYFFRRTRC